MTRARSLSRLANSSALSVDTNLNVGIGSTTPDVKLDVIGNMEVSGVLTATSFHGDGSSLSGIAVTTNVRTNSLVVTGVSTLGVVTGATYYGDGSGLTGLNVPAGFNELDAALFN